jgi:SAM-dependent methyltransferase
VFATRRPSDPELAENYAGYTREDHDSAITRARYRELLAGFEKYRRANRILDMGCGIGYFLEEAQRQGWEAHGSEFEPRAVAITRAKGLRCVQAPIGTDTFARGHFDVITAFEVVEHVRDPLAEAAMVAHLLRPGGLFYCTTPNFSSLSRRLFRGGWYVVEYPEHLLYFTPATLRSWLDRFGFRALKVQTSGFDVQQLPRLSRSAGGSGARCSDTEQLRVQIEQSSTLRAGKRILNSTLALTRSGDTIKGQFELRAGQ